MPRNSASTLADAIAIRKKGCARNRGGGRSLRGRRSTWKVPGLIRVDRPRKILGARICLTYRRARRAEVA
jgi:hypothetical protein